MGVGVGVWVGWDRVGYLWSNYECFPLSVFFSGNCFIELKLP